MDLILRTICREDVLLVLYYYGFEIDESIFNSLLWITFILTGGHQI